MSKVWLVLLYVAIRYIGHLKMRNGWTACLLDSSSLLVILSWEYNTGKLISLPSLKDSFQQLLVKMGWSWEADEILHALAYLVVSLLTQSFWEVVGEWRRRLIELLTCSALTNLYHSFVLKLEQGLLVFIEQASQHQCKTSLYLKKGSDFKSVRINRLWFLQDL